MSTNVNWLMQTSKHTVNFSILQDMGLTHPKIPKQNLGFKIKVFTRNLCKKTNVVRRSPSKFHINV